MFDTGAEIQLVSKQFCEDHNIEIQPIEKLTECSTMNGEIFGYEGCVELNVQIPGRDFSEDHLFLVTSAISHQKEIPIVLGTYFIESLSQYVQGFDKEEFDSLDYKLVINGTRYTLNNLHKLPEDLSAYKASERQNDECLAFHGEFSPLSNFHLSPFKIGNLRFHCTEQYIQYKKAMYFGDNLTANQIVQCADAFEVKRLGYRVTGFDRQQWKEHGYDLCIEGIRAKFQQNHNLMMLLKSTGNKTMVEATKDRLWGTRIPLRDQRVLDPESWYNTSWMLTMLATIRGEEN